MQKAYINALYNIMAADRRVCSVLSDSGTDYDKLMARDFPKQCFNFGISEQHKVAAASGMAAMGKIPFVYTTGAFLAYRAYEFVRNDICFQNRNVKLVGIGMGIGMGEWSTLGVSHHTTEDIAGLRALPNLMLMSASTPLQLVQMVRAAYEHEGPVYIRLGMSAEKELYQPNYQFCPGAADTLIHGSEYVIFGTGTIMSEAYQAALQLRNEGLSVQLVDVHTIKPMNQKAVLSAAAGKKMAFSVEEHNVYGGLGGAIAEIFSEAAIPVPLKRIGLYDTFAAGYGRTEEVRAANGLDAEGIYRQIKMCINQ